MTIGQGIIQANKMKKMEKIQFSREDIRQMEATAHRQALIEEGLYSIPTHKVHKSKKAYSRKGKSKRDFLSEID